MITYQVKRNGQIVLDRIQRLAAAKFTARHEGGDVLAVDGVSGVSWTVGAWDFTGRIPKWVQVGPKN